MTLVEITFELQKPLHDEDLARLAAFANTYGLRRFRLESGGKHLRFEYDASRLKATEVEGVLRKARIAVWRQVDPLAEVEKAVS